MARFPFYEKELVGVDTYGAKSSRETKIAGDGIKANESLIFGTSVWS
jgi:hypothetical protein